MANGDTVQSASRAIRILKAVVNAEQSDRWARLADVAAATDLNKGTVHRFLKSLEGEGWIDRDPDKRRYRIGPELIALASLAASHDRFLDQGRPVAEVLAERIGDTVYLVQRSGAELVCVFRQVGAYPIQTLILKPGDRRPLGLGASGLAVLSALPDDHLQQIVDQNIANDSECRALGKDKLLEQVASTRKQGYALVKGRAPASVGVGVAVIGPGGDPVGGLSIAAIQDRMKGVHHQIVVEQLAKEAARLSQSLEIQQ